MFNPTLPSKFGSTGRLILHTYCKSMLWSINSCQNRVSADQHHLIVSRGQVSTYRVRVFFEVIRWQVKWSQAQVYFFNSCEICCILYVPHNFDFKLTLGAKIQQVLTGREDMSVAFDFPHQGHPWSRSTSNFYALIGQNLTGEFMRKIYAASWSFFTLTAEADRLLCRLVMLLTVFFHWMYKMKFSC